jgi:HEAT repeat protein
MLGEDVTRLLGQVMLDLDPGWELAASTASLLRPRAIMRECIERYGRGTEPDVRLRAVMLLGSCGDETAVPFLSALIEDEEVVARAASAALRKLVMDGYAEPDVLRPILVTMARTWSASPEAEAEREQAAQLLREMSE